MEFMGCEGCKYTCLNFNQYPCKKCKGTSIQGSDEFEKRHNYFEQECVPVSQPDNVNHPSHYETGKFECIVIRERKVEKGMGRNRHTIADTWYARGVGMVRHDTHDPDLNLLTSEVLTSIEG